MQFPARFSDLPEYAFPRLRRLLEGTPPGGPELAMTIGEPKHPLPALVAATVAAHAARVRALSAERRHARAARQAIAGWLGRRYGVAVDPDTQIIAAERHPRGPVQRRPRALARDEGRRPPGDPDAEPLLPGLRRRRARRRRRAGAGARDRGDRLPARLRRAARRRSSTASPSATSARPRTRRARSPTPATGAASSRSPSGTTSASSPTNATPRSTATPRRPARSRWRRAAGADPERVVVFHSLSKRSNAPGLRSGFAAGGPRSIAALRQLRAYGGAPLPLPLQRAADRALAATRRTSTASRALYREKFALADRHARRHARLPPARRPASSSGSTSATARRRAAPLARDRRPRAARRLPRPRHGRRRRTPASDYIRVALVADAGRGRARPRRDPRHARAGDQPGEGRIDGNTHARPSAARR